MRKLLVIAVSVFLLEACDNVTVTGPKVEIKYYFGSQAEFNEHYIPLQNDHGGIKSWVPSEDSDCQGGKVFTFADGHNATFCPENGDESLFK